MGGCQDSHRMAVISPALFRAHKGHIYPYGYCCGDGFHYRNQRKCQAQNTKVIVTIKKQHYQMFLLFRCGIYLLAV